MTVSGIDEPPKPIKLWHRVMMALLIGTFVWGLTLYTGWRSTRQVFRDEQWFTQLFIMSDIKEKIQEYREIHGTEPDSLDSLKSDHERWYTSGIWVDGWGHPMVSRVDNGQLVVKSYGRDGKAGGVGLDHDLSHLDPRPPGSIPTFRQFLVDLSTTEMHIWSAVNGGLFFFVVVMDLGKRDSKPKRWSVQLVSTLIVGVAASVIAGFLMIVHLSGH